MSQSNQPQMYQIPEAQNNLFSNNYSAGISQYEENNYDAFNPNFQIQQSSVQHVQNIHQNSYEEQFRNEKTQNTKENVQQKQEQLKGIILEFQNQSEKGYYTYQEWKKLHQQLFNVEKANPMNFSADSNKKKPKNPMMTLLDQTIINMWRILKLINFGDDYVPTGLVYDTLLSVTKIDGSTQQVQAILKTIFFKFIQFNGKYLTENQRDQLAFFKVIRTVVEGYRKVIARKLQFQSQSFLQNQGKNKKNSKSFSGSHNISNSRYEQLYRLHNVFTYKKNLQKLKKIEQQFKQCSFQPQLNKFQDLNIESRYRNPSKAQLLSLQKSQNEYNSPIDEAQEVEYDEMNGNNLFYAKPVPEYPQSVPAGLQEHLERMQKSREIKRMNSIKTWKAPSNANLVSEFQIEKRNQQRKQHELSQYKIMFMIKVQVSKRIYRIKVRQNMDIRDTVNAIEKMVGFSHPDIQMIVKSYFMNWEKRRQRIEEMHGNSGGRDWQ